MKTIGDRIQYLMDTLAQDEPDGRMTLEKLGKYAGVSKAAVGQWRQDASIPQFDALQNLKKRKGVNPDWVRTGTGDMFITNGDMVSEEQAAYHPFLSLYEDLTPESKQAIVQMMQLLPKKENTAEITLNAEDFQTSPEQKGPATQQEKAG